MKEVGISDYARQQIRKLFSQRNSVNTLKRDPELTQIFDNFAFDEALKLTEEPVLEKTRCMCILASTIGCNAMRQFKVYVDVCLNVGIKPREIREVIYQTVPYVGFSKMIDFLLEMNEVFDDNDIKLPLSNQGTTTPEDRREKGREYIDGIFGAGMAEQMEKVNDVATNMASVSEEQSATSQEVTATINQLTESSKAVASSSDNVSGAAASVAEAVEQINESVKFFTV